MAKRKNSYLVYKYLNNSSKTMANKFIVFMRKKHPKIYEKELKGKI